MQGGDHRTTAQVLRDGDLSDAPITPEERLLLGLVETVTVAAHRVTDAFDILPPEFMDRGGAPAVPENPAPFGRVFP